MSYIPDSDPRLISAREQVLAAFQVGNLYSQSKPWEILPVAMEALADNDLPRRRSLAMMIGRQAQVAWAGQMDEVKAQA